MSNGNRSLGPFFLACFWLVFSGCGSEEGTPASERIWTPHAVPSCERLEPLVLQNPLTGGAFHCLWCSREWKWTLDADNKRLFVLVAVTCDRLSSEAHLEIRDPQEVLIWEQPVKQGDAETYCIPYEDPLTGVLTVGLYGHRGTRLSTKLIEEFRGSIHLKIFNEHGDLVSFRRR